MVNIIGVGVTIRETLRLEISEKLLSQQKTQSPVCSKVEILLTVRVQQSIAFPKAAK